MKHWIVTDTHFGHSKLQEYCGRPTDADELMVDNLEACLSPGDVLIHLGDVCIGQAEKWHKIVGEMPALKKWLIRGNHDGKGDRWYLEHGWDFIADQIRLHKYGLNIALSHKPAKDDGYDLNIHGHFHNSDHRRHEPELVDIKNKKQYLIMMEHNYIPMTLESIVKDFKRRANE